MSLPFAVNLMLIVLILIGLIVFLFVKLNQKPAEGFSQNKTKSLGMGREQYKLDSILEYIKRTINEYVNSNLLDMGLSGEEYQRRQAIVAELRNAMKNATSGDIQEKIYLKQYIYDLLARNYGFSEATLNLVIPFDEPDKLTQQDKFDILLYQYKELHGFQGLTKLIDKYELDRPKRVIEDQTVDSYIITGEEIDQIFSKEYRGLDFKDKLKILVQRIYQHYKGFGVIDEVRDMSIDGVSGGVSGIPSSMQMIEDEMELIHGMKQAKYPGYRSIWIFFRGKSIYLPFLSFGSDNELKRVCQNIYKYDNPGQLTETNGFKVNEMKDGSRVVVVRPPFAESWAFFVRKFDLPNMRLESLISSDKIRNAELPRELIKYLMKGAQVTAFTGPQGSGKTSLIMAAVKYIYATLTLRIQEMTFELHLRRLYPERNTLAFRETDSISGQAGLDLQKKTDGSVNILGEVATDPVAAWMIQMSQVASLFTIFTHHATSARELIWSLRNSLLKTGVFQNERIAEEQVVNAVKWDVHLRKEQDGRRYIERITEITAVSYEDWLDEESINYGESLENKLDALVALQREAFRRSSGRVWTARNVVEYRNGEYVAVSPISKSKIEQMIFHMNEEDRISFQQFVDRYWGEQQHE
ncbi:pilus assembly protein CpaF [Paenibacillus yonginensis]|uniref:Pilus assembly protein CpaF n=1 Tax=Paenibacillus yonginensis TaxID=1462996 RepID=A0A1B1N1N9_9BACL|nr:ATPase, T2SS/T4P/T4SS family [Paenibacillus yonginensis]ANS75350.1 pilus assembly protein CpaF [Paenibacillus yonginensis]